MTSFLGTETHRYDFDESSGAILDKVGSADSTLTRGAPTYNGNSVTYDGVDDGHRWSDANKPFDIGSDMSFYLKFKFLEEPIGSVLRVHGGGSSSAHDNSSPGAQWNDTSAENLVQILVPSTSPAKVEKNIGRDPGVNEMFVLVWSYVVATKEIKGVIKSNNLIDHSQTDTGLDSPVVRGFDLAEAFDEFGNIEVFQFGTVNGTAHSIADLQDTADALLGLSFEQIQTIKRQLIIDGSKKLRI